MDKELEILLQVLEKKGTLEKLDFLKENYENERLKRILFLTFNPLNVFGISSKKLEKEIKIEPDFKTDDLVEMLEYLEKNNTGTDQVIANIQYFINTQEEKYLDIIKQIITKSLTIGVNAKNLNKVWKNLIPDYEVQQGERLEQNIDKIENKDIILTQKFDGLRCSARVENHIVTLYSRNGNVYEGLHELEAELAQLDDGMYDGELLLNVEDKRSEKNIPTFIKETNMEYDDKLLNIIYAPMPSKELFKKTTSIVNSDMEDKKDINIWLYDMTPLENFDKMEDFDMPVEERKAILREIVEKNHEKCPHLKETKFIYEGKFDNALIQRLLKQVVGLKQEGMMINLHGAKYEFKRSKSMIKVKQMYPVDLRVVDVLEGSGANKGKVGALVVNYKGSPLKVGSGLSKDQREQFWNNKDLIMGKIITIKYFEETTNKKDNKKSLRFPIFLEVRNDKDEESYN